MKKVFLCGAETLVGEALSKQLLAETDSELVLVSVSRDLVPVERCEVIYVDDWDAKQIRKLCISARPDVVVDCVMENNPEQCEENRLRVQKINVDLFKNLAQASKICESFFVGFSSEYIYDGKKGPYDEVAPINAVGYFAKSCLAAENVCKTELKDYAVFRTTDIYGHSEYSQSDIISNILMENIKGNNQVFHNNSFSNPVLNEDVAKTVCYAIERRRSGFYNLGGSEYLDMASFVELLGQSFKLNMDLIQFETLPNELRRGLVTLKAETDLRSSFVSVRDGIASMKFNKDSAGNLRKHRNG